MLSFFWSVFSSVRAEYEDLLRNCGKCGPKTFLFWTLFRQWEFRVNRLYVSTEFSHKEIRWNYGILHSVFDYQKYLAKYDTSNWSSFGKTLFSNDSYKIIVQAKAKSAEVKCHQWSVSRFPSVLNKAFITEILKFQIRQPLLLNSFPNFKFSCIYHALCDLVPFAQFKKRQKHPCRSDTFIKLQAFHVF